MLGTGTCCLRVPINILSVCNVCSLFFSLLRNSAPMLANNIRSRLELCCFFFSEKTGCVSTVPEVRRGTTLTLWCYSLLKVYHCCLLLCCDSILLYMPLKINKTMIDICHPNLSFAIISQNNSVSL